MNIKPGYKTSEFWFTLVSFIFSGLYLIGLVRFEQKDQLTDIVSHGVESCILISGQLLILYKYIKGRERVKTASNNGRSTNKKPNKPRNRKTNTKPAK